MDLSKKIKQITGEREGPILKALKAEEIELREPKRGPEIEAFELDLGESRGSVSVVDRLGGGRLDQILSIEGGKDVKWTATEDKHAEKFASLVKEGLAQVKTRPPIFGAKFKESSILVSHMDGYTFTLASYQAGFEKLVEIFTLALSKAREKLA